MVSVCKLSTLDCSGCANITDKAVQMLAKHSGSLLVQLQLSKCYKIGSKSLEYLALHCPRLEVLHIGTLFAHVPTISYPPPDQCAIDDLGLYRLAEGCTELRDLSLRKCFRVTDQGLLSLARNLHVLETLNIKQVLTPSPVINWY